MKSEYSLTPYTKINSKWIKDLNVRPITKGKTEQELSDINHIKIFFDPPPGIIKIKTKISKWDLIKLKKLLYNKGNYKQGEKTAFRMGENNSK